MALVLAGLESPQPGDQAMSAQTNLGSRFAGSFKWISILLLVGLIVRSSLFATTGGQVDGRAEAKQVEEFGVRKVSSLDGTWQIIFDPENKI